MKNLLLGVLILLSGAQGYAAETIIIQDTVTGELNTYVTPSPSTLETNPIVITPIGR